MAGVQLEDIHHEGDAFMHDAKKQLFTASKEYDVPFTYSGGATAGNYTTSANVTQMGRVLKDGKFTKTCIVTLHDLGLNSFSNYATLFQCAEMDPILSRFTVFHIDFPCMKAPKLRNTRDNKENSDPNASNGEWDKNLVYPSMEELSKALMPAVMEYFSLTSIILMGTGLGANVAVRYSLQQPDRVMGLITMNPIVHQMGWPEWMSYKMSSISPDSLVDTVLAYLYTATELSDPGADLVAQTSQSIRRLDHNALSGLYQSFKQRAPIPMERPIPGITGNANNDKYLQVRSCIIIGDHASNFMEDAMELNSLSDPSKSNFCKLADAGAVVYEEQPSKVAEAITLFMQGLGFLATIIPQRLMKSRSNSISSTASIEEYNSTAAAVLANCRQRVSNPQGDASPSKAANVDISDGIGLIS